MWPNAQETADLVMFTKEILNGKVRFLCSDLSILFIGMSSFFPSSSIISSKSKSCMFLNVLSSLSSTKNRMIKGISATPMSYSKVKIQQTAKQSSVKSKVMCCTSRQSKSLISFKNISTLAIPVSHIKPDPSIAEEYSTLAIQPFSQVKPATSVITRHSIVTSVRINVSVTSTKTTPFPNDNTSKEKLDVLLKNIFLGIGALFAVFCVLVIGLYLRQR